MREQEKKIKQGKIIKLVILVLRGGEHQIISVPCYFFGKGGEENEYGED